MEHLTLRDMLKVAHTRENRGTFDVCLECCENWPCLHMRARTALGASSSDIDARARLAAVRAVLGERHYEDDGYCESGCVEDRPSMLAGRQPWPCFHERIRRAVEGE